MRDTVALKKQLRIQTGAVSRLFKEFGNYQKEAEEHQVLLDQYKEADPNEVEDLDWKIKNTQNMINESQKMVNDVKGRLTAQVAELRALVVEARTDSSLGETEEFTKADGQLQLISI